MADLLRGGPEVTVDTLGRFYPLHVVVLPLAVLGLVSVHMLFVQIQGMSLPDSFRALPEEKRAYHKFFSEFLVAEIPVWLFLGALLAALAAVFPRMLTPEADPAGAAPAGIKPEWYSFCSIRRSSCSREASSCSAKPCSPRCRCSSCWFRSWIAASPRAAAGVW